jgi:hypothetical protein
MAKIEIGLKGYVARAIARTTELGTGLEPSTACLGNRFWSCPFGSNHDSRRSVLATYRAGGKGVVFSPNYATVNLTTPDVAGRALSELGLKE